MIVAMTIHDESVNDMNSWLVHLGLAGGLKVAQTIISSHGERDRNERPKKQPKNRTLICLQTQAACELSVC